jgi:hypothetical protein
MSILEVKITQLCLVNTLNVQIGNDNTCHDNRVTIFVFADTKSDEGLGSVANALETAREFKNDGMRLYFFLSFLVFLTR